ncbi:C40 family peptidase [Priestia megaterium]|uniref:C40 family peptidase n=1 Tax=Priestia megaterium TaxID=1404 RepID=UPI0039A20388
MKKAIIGSITAAAVLFSGASPFIAPAQTVEAASYSYKDTAIATGKKLMGVPYKWGGTTTKGFDCSGFIQYIFKKAGKTLPRTTEQMYQVGTSVSKAKLQKGDLVFFQTYKKGPSHVGVYLGNNQFLQASTSKGVTITSLSNSYWKARYIGAKRI